MPNKVSRPLAIAALVTAEPISLGTKHLFCHKTAFVTDKMPTVTKNNNCDIKKIPTH